MYKSTPFSHRRDIVYINAGYGKNVTEHSMLDTLGSIKQIIEDEIVFGYSQLRNATVGYSELSFRSDL